MKYFNTKHEKDSAKITTLVMLILVLLLFVVGQDYKEQPEEYGVAINFGDSSPVGGNIQPDKPEDINEEPQDVIENEDIVEEEVVEEEVIEEEKVEEETEAEEEKLIEEKAAEEKVAEEKAAEEIEEANKAAEAAEKILREEAEEAAEKIKNEEEAKQKAEAETEAKEIAAAAAKAEKEAKEAQAAKKKTEAKKAAAAKAAAAEKAKAAAEAKAQAEADAKAKAAADAAAKKAREGTPFALIENAPIYPGCEGGDNNARKQCMNEKIKQFLVNNFDTDLASDLTGIQKINISFKINTSGQVVSISARASDPKLEAEAKRVTRLLPKMKPGIQQGTPVVVSYGLPIRIQMED